TSVAFYSEVGCVAGVLIGDAVTALVVVLRVFRSPPIGHVAVQVELASLIVKAVDDLVSDDHADAAIVRGRVLIGTEERKLEDSSGEVDGVHLSIVVGVDGGRSHAPLGAIKWTPDLVELTM